MKEIDPGHVYELDHLDEQHSHTLSQKTVIRFVKRMGFKYPGNANAHPGITTQELLRAAIKRTLHVDTQEHDELNLDALEHMRQALYLFELRASRRRGEVLAPRRWRSAIDGVPGLRHDIENEPTCVVCGHISCTEEHL